MHARAVSCFVPPVLAHGALCQELLLELEELHVQLLAAAGGDVAHERFDLSVAECQSALADLLWGNRPTAPRARLH